MLEYIKAYFRPIRSVKLPKIIGPITAPALSNEEIQDPSSTDIAEPNGFSVVLLDSFCKADDDHVNAVPAENAAICTEKRIKIYSCEGVINKIFLLLNKYSAFQLELSSLNVFLNIPLDYKTIFLKTTLY